MLCNHQCWCMFGRCYCWVADGMATAGLEWWQMLLPCGRWNGHWVKLFQFEFWGVKQNLIPYMRQIVFTYIPIQGWIVDPYIQSFFNGSHEVLLLSPHNTKILQWDLVTSGVKMVKDWGGGFEMFLEPLSKCSGWFTYIFIITLHPVAFESVDDSTSILDRILVFWSHQEVFDCFTSFEVYLYPMVVTSSLETFTEPSLIWNSDVWFLDVVSSRLLLFVIVPTGIRVSDLHFYSIEGPCRVFAGG